MEERIKKKVTIICLLIGAIIVCLTIGLIIKFMINRDIEIDTPYGSLYYPAKWKKEVRIETNNEENYSVCFYSLLEDQCEYHLFDVVFDGNEGNLIGYIDDVSISVLFYDIDASNLDNEYVDTFNAMSEDVTYLISRLEKLDGFSVDGITNIAGEINIDTKYAKLSYPKKWEDVLNFKINESDGYVVEFYSKLDGKENVHLFDLYFGKLEEEAVAKLKDEDLNVYVDFYDLNIDDTWSEKDKNICNGMQEDFNYIIDGLFEDGKLEKTE